MSNVAGSRASTATRTRTTEQPNTASPSIADVQAAYAAEVTRRHELEAELAKQAEQHEAIIELARSEWKRNQAEIAELRRGVDAQHAAELEHLREQVASKEAGLDIARETWKAQRARIADLEAALVAALGSEEAAVAFLG